MNISFSEHGGLPIVTISGAMDSQNAGTLFDELVQCIIEGRSRLIIDVSGTKRVTRAGVRGLLVAAHMLQSRAGEMRICGASKAVGDFLQGLGFHHLLKLDPTLEDALGALTCGMKDIPAGPRTVTPEPHCRKNASTVSVSADGQMPCPFANRANGNHRQRLAG